MFADLSTERPASWNSHLGCAGAQDASTIMELDPALTLLGPNPALVRTDWAGPMSVRRWHKEQGMGVAHGVEGKLSLQLKTM